MGNRLLLLCALCSISAPFLASDRVQASALPVQDISGDEELLERGQFEIVLRAAERARALAKASGDTRGEAWSLGRLGDAYFFRGDTARALGFYQLSLSLMRDLGDDAGEATELKNVGIALLNLARYQEALAYLNEALVLSQKLGQPILAASAMENMGIVYMFLGAYHRALETFEETLQVALQNGLTDQLHHLQVDMGQLSLSLQQPARAREQFESALAMARREGHIIGQSLALEGISVACFRLGDIDGAIRSAREELRLSRLSQFGGGVTYSLWNLGYFTLDTDPAAALGYFRRALAAGNTGAENIFWWQWSLLGDVHARLGDTDQALAHYYRAVDGLELYRTGIVAEEHRASFLGRNEYLYQELIGLLMKRNEQYPGQGNDVRAFEVFERSRARTMVEAVAKALNYDPTIKVPEFPHPLSLGESQALLGKSAALIAYALSRDDVYAFLLTRDAFQARKLTVSRRVLEARVTNYVELLGREDGHGWRNIGQRLYAELMAPLEPLWPPGIRRLVIVPSGILHYLPFETLESSGYLIEKLAVSYAPSVTVLAELMTPQSAKDSQSQADLLVFADPSPMLRAASGDRSVVAGLLRTLFEDEGLPTASLPFSAAEAEAIARYGGAESDVFTGAEASEHRVKNMPLDRYRVIHFATHGLISQQSPERSSLLLSPGSSDEDGFLQASEIFQLKLSADLAVLSGCRTARGRILAGEGVAGLAQACFYAGARSVLASLWNVDDQQTARFMESFYKHLAAGKSKGEALRSAKLDQLCADRKASPREWASFILIGEADGKILLRRPSNWGLAVFVGCSLVGVALILWRWRHRLILGNPGA